MSLLSRATWFIVAVLLSTGCERKAQPAPLAEDLRAARQAMSLSEVSLMLRSGYKDKVIMAEVTRRRVPQKPDAQTEAALVRSGAGQALIQVLKSDSHVLMKTEKEAFDYLAAKRASGTETERVAGQHELVAKEEVPPNKQDVVEQTRQNLRNADAYKAQKEALETRIASQEAQISLLRRNGYNEAQLVEYNEKLDRYREQLSGLKQPLP